MQLRIVLAQFWRDLRAQRLRTGLTLFGLAWGTFCVVLLLSFGEGLSRKQMDTMEGLGTRIVLLWGARTSVPYEGLPRGRAIRIEDADADRILRQVDGVTNATPEYSREVMLKGPHGESSASLSAVRPCFGRMRRVEPEAGGRFISERDETERRHVCIVGSRLRKELFGTEPAIGRSLEIQGIPFTVVGTLPEKQQDSNYNGPDDGKVFIPSTVAMASFGDRYPSNLVVEVAAGVKSADVVTGIYEALGRAHHFEPTDKEALMVWDVGEMIAMVTTIFVGFRVFLGLIGALTLAVAGIGVANVMSMVVEDRTSQIGISMALGARHSWVLGQILLETLLVTAAGGIIGVTLAGAIVFGCQALPLENSIGDPVFSGRIAMITAGILGMIGIAAGVGPARRAAYLNPAEALRSQ
jgi:putative ABC transport system permease protein